MHTNYLKLYKMTVLVLQILVLCRTQIFRVSSEYERRFLSIFEHEHHRALDIRTSSGTNIKYVVLLWSKILKTFICSASISEYLTLIRTSSEHERTKNDNFELRASTNAHFSERERASIERFEVRHNTTMKQHIFIPVNKSVILSSYEATHHTSK